jgi:hypothetical protein
MAIQPQPEVAGASEATSPDLGTSLAPVAPPVPAPSVEPLRMIVGAAVIGAGLLFVGAILWAALAHFKGSSDIVAVVGSVTGVVGTVVSAFFGIQASQAQGTQAQQTAQNAQQAASRAQVDASNARRSAVANAERGARGEALAHVVRRARSAVREAATTAEGTSFAPSPETHATLVNSIEEAAALADQLFPESQR